MISFLINFFLRSKVLDNKKRLVDQTAGAWEVTKL